MTDLNAAHQHLSDYFTATAQTSGTFSASMAVTPEAVKPILRLVHHMLQPGRHLVLLGDSGCGKATLVHAAGRLAGCPCTRPQDFGQDLRANFRQQLKVSPGCGRGTSLLLSSPGACCADLGCAPRCLLLALRLLVQSLYRASGVAHCMHAELLHPPCINTNITVLLTYCGQSVCRLQA